MSIDLDDFALEDDLTAPVPLAQVNVAKAYGLRPYQAEAVESVLKGFTEPDIRAQLIVLATGCGKTIVFSALARQAVEQGQKVLILAHTDELLEQAIDKLARSTGLKAAKEKANSYAGRWEKVVVASVQTMQRLRLQAWPADHFGLVIIDEAHRSLAESYQNVIKHFTGRLVGVTATADRGDKRALGDIYQRVAYEYGLLPAVRDGWLVRPIVKTMPVSIDLKGVRSTRTSEGSDLDRTEVSKRLAPFLDKIAEAIHAEAKERKIILFLPSVETAQLMSDAMNKVGITCDYVSGECEDRAEKIAKYKDGRLQAICNMALLTEGFDHDSIDTLVVLRPTKIRSLYAQMIGRGTRPLNSIASALAAAPDAATRLQLIKGSAKPHVTILDFLWLYERHDLIKPASLVSTDPKVVEAMGDVQGDLLEAEQKAERDLLKKLEDEVRKNAKKKSKVIDPITFATELGDVALADYEPETTRDAEPPSEKQLAILRNNGIDVAAVKYRGQASVIIDRIFARHARKLATVRQLHFLHKLGIDASAMGQDEASAIIARQMEKWKR